MKRVYVYDLASIPGWEDLFEALGMDYSNEEGLVFEGPDYYEVDEFLAELFNWPGIPFDELDRNYEFNFVEKKENGFFAIFTGWKNLSGGKDYQYYFRLKKRLTPGQFDQLRSWVAQKEAQAGRLSVQPQVGSIMENESPAPLALDKSGRSLFERLAILTELVKSDQGSTRAETATGYAFGYFRNEVRVGPISPMDIIIRPITVQVFPVGREVYATLSLILPSLIRNLEDIKPPLEFEAEAAEGQPLTLRRFLWPEDWRSEERLEAIIREFAEKANEIFFLFCQEKVEEG